MSRVRADIEPFRVFIRISLFELVRIDINFPSFFIKGALYENTMKTNPAMSTLGIIIVHPAF